MKVRLHSQVHEWRARDEDRVLRFYRAEWDSREWHFFTTTKADPEWYPLPNPQLEHFEALREVLWRKYQRRRLPWRFIEELDALLENLRREHGVSNANTGTATDIDTEED